MKPIGNRILVRLLDSNKPVEDNELETAKAVQEDVIFASVVAVGDEVTRDFTSGQVVFFEKYLAQDITINEEVLKIVEVKDILGTEE